MPEKLEVELWRNNSPRAVKLEEAIKRAGYNVRTVRTACENPSIGWPDGRYLPATGYRDIEVALSLN